MKSKDLIIRLQRESKKYIQENEAFVCGMNRNMLILYNIMYLLILILYAGLAHKVIGNAPVDRIYYYAVLIQIVVFISMSVRYQVKRSYRETGIACALFQLYVMCFVSIISVYPKEFEGPALYFAPMAIAFSIAFVFTWRTTVLLALVEIVGFLFLSDMIKTNENFLSDLYSSILTITLILICAYAVNSVRIKENIFRNQLKELGTMDKLTGIFNRNHTESLSREFVEQRRSHSAALFVLDVDNFKTINDTFGHSQGDEVLRQFGQILKDSVREDDIVGRFGGDEFLILLKNVADPQMIMEKAKVIQRRTAQILKEQTTYRFSCSIGVAVQKEKEEATFQQLFSKADQALYQVKKNGKADVKIFSATGDEEIVDRRTILVVDDLEVSRAVLRSCFEDDWVILEAENGEQALELLHKYKGHITAILLDLEMPVMSGYQVVEKLAEDPMLKNIPVLVITAHEPREIDLKELGAMAVVTKPFDPVEVKRTVKESIENFKSRKTGN